MRDIGMIKANVFFFVLFFCGINSLKAEVDKLRVMWEGDASSTAIIGWNQISGSNPTLYFGTTDRGTRLKQYLYSKSVTLSTSSRGMDSKFVHLSGLNANTVYYFVVADSEGFSNRYYFKTAPDSRNEKIKMISGGDSRNYRKIRREANIMVSKVQPTCVMFSGDMTNNSSPTEWKAWLDDWQLTFSADGQIFPLIVARGNHEPDNKLMTEMFGLRAAAIYYSVQIGGDLVNIISLNSLHPSAPAQSGWLRQELERSQGFKWKIAQYHHSISPHTSKKKMRLDLLKHWAPLFYKFGVDLAIESDAHVMKTSYPIKPSIGPNAERGFERAGDGTVYIGEGCWGAPLRTVNIENAWTRHTGSFNQFKLIFVSSSGIEIRTIPIPESSYRIPTFDKVEPFRVPSDFPVWRKDSDGVLQIGRPDFFEADLLSARESVIFNLKDIEIENGKAILGISTENEPSGCTLEISRSSDGGKTFTNLRNEKSVLASQINYSCTDLDITGKRTITYRYIMRAPDNSILFTELQEQTYLSEEPKVNDMLSTWERFARLEVPGNKLLRFSYSLENRAAVSAKVLRVNKSLVKSIDLPVQSVGKHVKELDVSDLGQGDYILLVFSNKKVIRKYRFRISA